MPNLRYNLRRHSFFNTAISYAYYNIFHIGNWVSEVDIGVGTTYDVDNALDAFAEMAPKSVFIGVWCLADAETWV